MTRREQIAFVRGLSLSIAENVAANILAGKIPNTWDGHEFRALLSELHDASARMSQIRREPRRSRARAFRTIMLQDYDTMARPTVKSGPA